MIDYKYIKEEVTKVLGGDNSGHSMEHIFKVLKNADIILESIDNSLVDKDVVKITCYLHDVDDYKIVGHEKAKTLANTHHVLNNIDVTQEQKEKIIHIIENMGYSKYLDGIRPTSLEGKVVSDADMLDLGANGIIRTLESGFVKGRPVFDVDNLPAVHESTVEYQKAQMPSINHFFEKVLLIKDIMFTEKGTELALKRHRIMYDFLENFFEERHEDCSAWLELLKEHKA